MMPICPTRPILLKNVMSLSKFLLLALCLWVLALLSHTLRGPLMSHFSIRSSHLPSAERIRASLKNRNEKTIIPESIANISSGKRDSSTAYKDASGHSELLEKRHVVFLKAHKAASTTMQNILMRFAMARNLSILLLKDDIHLNQRGTHIDPERVIEHPEGAKFDILCNHIIYNRSEISPYFPEDTVYIGIVREPLQLFWSAFVYYSQVWQHMELNYILSLYPEDPLHGFLNNTSQLKMADPRKSYLNNRMSVDFGLPMEDFETTKADSHRIEEFVLQVLRDFDLILIADMFDESVVLLRRYMNWCFKDIIYVRSNAYIPRVITPNNTWIQKTNFTDNDRDFFKKWAAIDYALYGQSLAVFKNKIKLEQMFQEEVDAFRKVRDQVDNFCGTTDTNKTSGGSLFVEKNEWTAPFPVTHSDCELMKMSEVHFVDLVKSAQLQRMNQSNAQQAPLTDN